MRPRVWFAALALALGLAGCLFPAEDLSTPTSAPTPALVSIPSSTPTLSPTRTPRPPTVYATARDFPVNCRFGPGTFYAVVDNLTPFQRAQVAGRDIKSAWWYLHNPNFPDQFCWVAASATDLDGETESLPVVDPPYVTVSKLEVRAEPPRITVGCEAFPQYVLIVGEITTDGPTLVEWRWETSAGEVTREEPRVFTEAATQTVQKSLVIYGPNNYWAQLHILTPNDVVMQVQFVANCIP